MSQRPSRGVLTMLCPGLIVLRGVFSPLDFDSNTVTVSHPELKAGPVLSSREPALTRSRRSQQAKWGRKESVRTSPPELGVDWFSSFL